jgi:general stress protein CsbA
MCPPTPETSPKEVAQLGEPKLVGRTSRKTLFWGFLLASVFFAVAVAPVVVAVRILVADWSKNGFDSVVLFAISVFSLWAGRVLWRKTNRLRHRQVVVHAHGLSYRDGSTCLIFPWDQIEEVRWGVMGHHEESFIAVDGIIPVPGTRVRTHWHTSHHIRVRRKDGVCLDLTDELQNIVELGRAIQQGTSRPLGGE